MSETTGTIIKGREGVDLNGERSTPGLVPTNELAVAKKISNNQLIEEEKSLKKVETAVEQKYRGIRGYLRIFQVTRVIAMLSLYLYLDQLDLHQSRDKKHSRQRDRKSVV